jgi:hypothetical protein
VSLLSVFFAPLTAPLFYFAAGSAGQQDEQKKHDDKASKIKARRAHAATSPNSLCHIITQMMLLPMPGIRSHFRLRRGEHYMKTEWSI